MSTKIMGILNVTPDSFFDGGKYDSFGEAKKQIDDMIKSGVDIIDVGGFSSRPNSLLPSIEEELDRIIPVLEYLESLDVEVSVDTCRSEVVKELVKYKNIKYINDISGLQDEKILDLLKNTNIGYILMHIKGTPENMQDNPIYEDVIKEINKFFDEKLTLLKSKGIKNIVLDPGFGFGKTIEHNYEILKNLDKFKIYGYPVLCGLSRKSMIYKPLGLSPSEVLSETIALNMLAISKGANIIRVHDVKEHIGVVKLGEYLKTEISSYKDALDNIFRYEIIRDYSLEKAKNALTKLGNPDKNYKIIHIAGTNGKGSVSKMVFSVLKSAGKKVGVFTSPHLIDIRERFETEEGLISKKDFVKVLNQVLKTSDDLSYFEKCTLIALEYFKQKKCEYVILETGCGGRLDTTNIVNPIITAITSIGIDHTELLGDTLEKIAFEKAGIIKENVPVVYNFENEIIEKKAKEVNALIIFNDKKIKTNLLGKHQEKNAAIAYEICKYIGIDENIINKGLQNVVHRGRLDLITDNILVDGAHNTDGLKTLKEYIEINIKNNYDNICYCFSLKKGKDINLVFEVFGEDKKYVLIDSDSNLLADFADYRGKYDFMTNKKLLEQAKSNKKDFYVVFGSLYMIGEFLG
ncbi:MAG: dihydropteroate synthase [Candidatus Gracilibacteria bacterium]|nr:dihydropteroate synthase [Candidatus Gracilibacteria bacterium]